MTANNKPPRSGRTTRSSDFTKRSLDASHRREVFVNRQPGSIFLTGEYDGLPLVQGLLSRTGAYVGFHVVREHGAITKILDPSLTREALKDSEIVFAHEAIPQ